MGKKQKIDETVAARVRQLCDKHSIKLFSGKELEDLLSTGDVNTLGAGGIGSCVRLTGNHIDYVVKTFLGCRAELSLEEEVVILARVRGVAGMQQVVGVCLQKLAVLTEYAGPTLESRAKQVTFGMLRHVVLQVGASVAHLTNMRLQHVDIKSYNVCVRGTPDKPSVTLIDLGLATKIGEQVYAKPVSGSAWMAPEVRSAGQVTDSSDAYSLACMCQELAECCVDTQCLPEFMRCVRRSLLPSSRKRQGMAELVESVRKIPCPVVDAPRGKGKRNAKR